MRIPLLNWLPDVYSLLNQGQSDALNVYPTGSGYAPWRGLNVVSTTGLGGQCRGAISGTDDTGAAYTFAGDGSKLYSLSGGTFSDVSKSGDYSPGSEENWEFAIFGERVIATQIDDPVQYFDVGSSSVFADLSGSPPQARHIAIVRDFVVLGNTANSSKEVIWSGLNDSEEWTAGVKQSDSETLPDGGAVQKLTGGEFGIVFQERAITRMTFVGPPLYFQFDTVETSRGVDIPGFVLKVGGLVYYHSPEGFFVTDGATSQPIGNQKIDQWFNSHLQNGTTHLCSAGFAPMKNLVCFSFCSTDATDTSAPDSMLIFNRATGQWTYARMPHERIFSALTSAVTLEQLGAIYSNIEEVPASFDSPIWNGGSIYLAGFNRDHQLGSFTGDTLAASVRSSDFEGAAGMRALITNVRPLCDTPAATVTCYGRERLADAFQATEVAQMQPNADVPLLSSGRYFQIGFDIPAGEEWTFINGADVDVQEDGEL